MRDGHLKLKQSHLYEESGLGGVEDHAQVLQDAVEVGRSHAAVAYNPGVAP